MLYSLQDFHTDDLICFSDTAEGAIFIPILQEYKILQEPDTESQICPLINVL